MSEWGVGADLLLDLVALGGDVAGVDGAGGDGVDADAAVGVVECSGAAGTSLVAAAVFAALSGIVERPTLATFAALESIAAIVYLGIVVTALGFVLWFTGVQRMGVGTAGLCAGLAPPAAAILGMLFGAPPPSPGVWAGMATIAAGLILGFLPRGQRRVPHASARGG